jgi:hypothetical protein
MKRIFKNPNSLIISKQIIYNSKKDNSKLSEILQKEQKGFCAYTEEYIGINDAKDIEHFNPNLKEQPNDDYYNWYLVKHLPNQRKTKNWITPILMPYAEDFENRIIYDNGEYFAKLNDDEANNLIILLDLNNQKKVEDRKNYIKRRRESINDRKLQTKTEIIKYFQDKIDNEIKSISYLRAIQEEFKINIWNMIPEPK